jgi:AraC-like DNA-binding protein
MESFHTACFGRERCEAGDLPRHRHAGGYVTLILAGGYEEAGDAGRFRAGPGDLLVHHRFEAHLNRFARLSADVLNLPLPPGAQAGAYCRVADPDAAMRLAERDIRAAAALLIDNAAPAESEQDWPDLLAAELRRSAPLAIGEWGRRRGLAASALSRGFRQVFGTTPQRFRAEARARRAWSVAMATRRPLADIAFDLGFADQAHMTRAVAAMTGRPPGRWRA